MPKKLAVSLDHEVEFFDVDAYRIVWHGNYPKYFETARCKLLELIDFTYEDMEKSCYFFPVIDISVRYVRPLIFRQKFVITATLLEWEHKLKISYLITDKLTGERLTKGFTSQIAVSMPGQTIQFVSPAVLTDKVSAAMSKA